MNLSPVYHWSPAERYEYINRLGLRPGSTPTVAGGTLQYVCTAPDPQRAWAISGAMDYVGDIEYWDLWQIRLADTDDIRVRPDFGPTVHEIKIHNVVPADRIWWIGRRYDLGVPGPGQLPPLPRTHPAISRPAPS